MLEGRALALLRLRDAFSQRPQRLALSGAAGDHGVEEQPLLGGGREGLLEPLVHVGGRAGELDEAVPLVPVRERVAYARQVGEDRVDGLASEQLPGGQLPAAVLAEQGRSEVAASTDSSATNAVARRGVAGSSRSTAAVTTPRVPSEPMNSCLRS